MSSVVISGDTSGAITLAAPSVSGTNTATLPAATGTVMVSGNMPAFSAYNPSTQNPSRYTWTKATLSSENFDTNNCFDSTTNYRFTPNVAGYYQFNAVGAATASPTEAYVAIRQNGSGVALDWFNGTGVNQWVGGISDLIYANGTTDYFELYVYTDASSPAFSGLRLSGSLVRTA